jgi:hypothetical protein
MRSIGGFPGVDFPPWPDYINTVLPTSAGSIVTFDYPAVSTSTTQISSSPGFVQVVTQNQNVWFCPNSTGANIPTTQGLAGQSIQTLVSNAVPLLSGLPPNSTGGSVAFPTTGGSVSLMFWKK